MTMRHLNQPTSPIAAIQMEVMLGLWVISRSSDYFREQSPTCPVCILTPTIMKALIIRIGFPLKGLYKGYYKESIRVQASRQL